MPETKNRPHHSLEDIKRLVHEGNRIVSKQATLDGSYIGFKKEDIYKVVLDLKASDFYKSMQSEKNELLWQDVYHHRLDKKDMTLYVKLQIKKHAVVISFKEQ